MSQNATEVRVAVTGAVSVGPTSSTAPADADSPLTGFVDLGYVSEDGVTETRDRSTNKIKAWQNADNVREVVTEASLSYKFVLIQTNADTVGLFYGTTVDPVTGSVKIVPSKTGGRKSFVVDVIDDDQFIRTYIPSGEITEVGDQVYQSGEAIGYEVTVTAYPSAALLDADGNPASAEKFYSDLVVDAG